MVEIYCPRCAWHPQADSRWVCAPAIGGCGHLWNTFDTRGVCPHCHWQWQITMCLSCQQFSPHEEWYHDPKPGPARHVAGSEDDEDVGLRELART